MTSMPRASQAAAPASGRPTPSPRALQKQRLSQRKRTGARAQRVRRSAPAWTLKGATEFSDDPVLRDPVQVIGMLKIWCPRVCEHLIQRTTVTRQPGVAGRNRKPGSWALVFFAQVMTGSPDWEPFWAQNQSSSELWEACGFAPGHVPSWATFQERFSELEHPRFVSAFVDAAEHFIRVAAKAEPRALRNFHIDGTAANTHALLEHCCKDYGHERRCKDLDGRLARHVARAWDEEVEADRH